MNATPPEANTEYSRGVERSDAGFARAESHVESRAESRAESAESRAESRAESAESRGERAESRAERADLADPRTRTRARTTRGGPLGAAILATTMLGAVLLLVAEFTTLFELRTAAATTTARSISTGSHHGYALVPIALLAAVMGYAVWAAASRPALLAIGALGVLALLIALLGDLPDTNAGGLVLSASYYVTATSTPSAGFCMETFGAVVLLVTCVSGFLLIGAPGDGPGAGQGDRPGAGPGEGPGDGPGDGPPGQLSGR